ncbi:MAG: sporadic carbohydrate cluster protein, TIGR04323 family [Magnetovibrio sp.]|nr:sporadic carbohydrate cluster protein, TIGR04323 family [Magnetovibrio sp.]
MNKQLGYRGYIGSRPYRGQNTPQHVQNLVIRDFCQRHEYPYLLSATEYHMDGCYIMLEEVLRELSSVQGIVMYSIFMLPQNQKRRLACIQSIFKAGCTLHGAVENISISNLEDLEHLEELLGIHHITQNRQIDLGAFL